MSNLVEDRIRNLSTEALKKERKRNTSALQAIEERREMLIEEKFAIQREIEKRDGVEGHE
jgi:hypothetical protein